MAIPKMTQWANSQIFIGGSPTQKTYKGTAWSTDRYRFSIQIILNSIHTTRSGTALIDSLWKRVLIAPVDEATTDQGELLGSASSVKSIDSVKYNAMDQKSPADVTKTEGNPASLWDADVEIPNIGSEYIVQFTPGFYRSKNPAINMGLSGFRPDCMLFHELVHASRGTRGVFDDRINNDLLGLGVTMARYDNYDEFFAILLTNIYRSERYPGTDLRRSHSIVFEKYHLPQDFSKVCAFQRMMDILFQQSPTLSRAFAKSVRAAFNPIRDYYGKVGSTCT